MATPLEDGSFGRPRTKRQRDFLAVASKLFAERGYHNVGVNDISAELGLSGPSLYRHFAGKEEVLVAVMDDICIAQLEGIRETVTSFADPRERLEVMVERHIEFVADQAENFQTWITDFNVLPAPDRHRLRYLMHLYMDEWIRTLRQIRPELSQELANVICHAGIALLQSPVEHHVEIDPEDRAAILKAMALDALLGVGDTAKPAAAQKQRRARAKS
jgi:AcrR family transcriptional regulator